MDEGGVPKNVLVSAWILQLLLSQHGIDTPPFSEDFSCFHPDLLAKEGKERLIICSSYIVNNRTKYS